MRVDYTQS